MLKTNKERLVWLDICRIIAILAVVGFHVLYEFTLDGNTRIIGYEGVSLFFITSGFILSKSYPTLKSFDITWFLKRYVKIASLYYPTLVTISLLFISQPLIDRLKDLLIHFTFLNWISFEYSFSIISPAWFVVPIIALYLVFPYLNNLTKKYSFFIAVAVLLSLANRYFDVSLVSFSPFFFLAEFCFGMALSNKQKDIFILTPLLFAFINPLMVLSFIFFYVLSISNINFFPNIISKIGSHTFEIFLFHESLMKVVLGKWFIFGLDTLPSLIVLCMGLLITLKIRTLLENYLMPKLSTAHPG